MRSVEKIFAHMHTLSWHSHYPRFRKAENKLYKRLCPNLWKMVKLGIKKELI